MKHQIFNSNDPSTIISICYNNIAFMDKGIVSRLMNSFIINSNMAYFLLFNLPELLIKECHQDTKSLRINKLCISDF